MSPEVTEVLAFLGDALADRKARLTRGAIVGEGEALAVNYKAACAEIRLIESLAQKIDEVFNRKEKAEQADSGLTPMPEEG
jgi:hypothetical protein